MSIGISQVKPGPSPNKTTISHPYKPFGTLFPFSNQLRPPQIPKVRIPIFRIPKPLKLSQGRWETNHRDSELRRLVLPSHARCLLLSAPFSFAIRQGKNEPSPHFTREETESRREENIKTAPL